MGVNIRWGTKGQSVSLCRNIIIWDSCVQGNIIYLLRKCILYFQIIRVFFTSWETRALINTFSLTSSILEWVPLGVGKKWQKQRQFTKLLIGPEEKKKKPDACVPVQAAYSEQWCIYKTRLGAETDKEKLRRNRGTDASEGGKKSLSRKAGKRQKHKTWQR